MLAPWVLASLTLPVVLLLDVLYRWWRDGADRRTLTAPLRVLLQLTMRWHVELLWEDRRRVGGVVSLMVKVSSGGSGSVV